MRTKWQGWTLGMVLVMLALPARAWAQDADVVIEWNRILQTTIATPGALPPTVFFTRPYALMHAAIFDAMNSIDRAYTPLAFEVDALTGASRGAAAAQAAHDVLSALFPNQRTTFAAPLAAALARFTGDAGREGARVGAEAARRWLELRATDGWSGTPPEYLLPGLPGYYQVTPPQNAAVTFSHYPDVQPFVVGNGRQFLVEPPPALTSVHYAADFNEVKAIGSAASATRTAEQTLIAQLWARVGTPTSLDNIWNNVARDVAQSRGASGTETARLFALLNTAIHDGLLTSFTGKFLYGLWRPVTAIRGADLDANPATAADAAWLPLITTPPYPSYPGNMACVGATAARVLARFFGRDDIAFTATWTLTNGTPNTRRYNGFREMADEEARSRVYGGIHFAFDNLASVGACTALADYVFENALRVRPR
jgi:hypothetical protein